MKRPFKQHRPLFSAPPKPPSSGGGVLKKVGQYLWTGLKRFALLFGFLMIFNIVLVMLITASSLSTSSSAPSLPKEMVLFLEFEGGLRDLPSPPSFADPFAEEDLTVRQIVDALDSAAQDDRVKGVLARMRAGNFSMAHSTEVRAAVKRFRESGKFAHIYSSSYGEGGGIGRYYLASAFEEIWMQPLGIVSIPGIHAEMPFMRGALDKLGVEPQFYKRNEYKTAYESITNRSISKENKEMMIRLVEDIKSQFLGEVAKARGLERRGLERLVNEGLFTADEALESGLITHMDYGDVLLENVAEVLTGQRDYDQINLVNVKRYAKTSGQKDVGETLMLSSKPQVALVYAVGAIMPTSGSGGPGFADDGIAAADEIAPALFDAAKNDDIDAVVLRIDSPGGSPTASESILRGVQKVKEAGKPVIVSMGASAASGGYWIASAADYIYALPTTLTGSIGVVGGKFAIQDLTTKLGINWDSVSWGKNAAMWSLTTPFDEAEAERINAMLDNVYENFVERVATGRGMSVEEVEKVAGGRVWTGRGALKTGLVNDLGGLDKALDFTAKALGEDNAEDVDVVILPKPKTPFEQFIALLEGQVSFQNQLKDIVAPVSKFLNVQSAPHNYMTYEFLRLE